MSRACYASNSKTPGRTRAEKERDAMVRYRRIYRRGAGAPILLNGLQKLEYRGYDSAGVAVYNSTGLHAVKSKGRLSVLRAFGGGELPGTVGIGHTRWATHGAPSDVNSHPQVSDGGKFVVVHNGIIENYLELKNLTMGRGGVRLGYGHRGGGPAAGILLYRDVLEAIQKVSARVEGSYALGILCADCPEKLFAVRKDSPLIIGVGQGETSSPAMCPPSSPTPGTSTA